jgi:phosphoglycolate phosphatase
VVTIQCGEKSFSNIQAVFFDKDGTLANSEAFLRSLGQKRSRLVDARVPGVQEPLLMAFGLETSTLNPKGLIAVGGRRDNEIAAAAYIAETGRDWVEALEIAQTAFQEADGYLQPKAVHTPLFAGCLETLRSLSKAGLKLGIISSDTLENVRSFAQTYQLTDYLQLQWGEGLESGLRKPDPEIFHSACQKLGVSPNAALMIGDAATDMNMARAAGAGGCIGAGWGWSQPITLAQADVMLEQPAQIQVD